MDMCTAPLTHPRAWSLTKRSPSSHRRPKRYKMSVSVPLTHLASRLPLSSPTSLIFGARAECHFQHRAQCIIVLPEPSGPHGVLLLPTSPLASLGD